MEKSKILTIATAVFGIIGILLFVRVMMADDGASIDGAVGTFVSYAYYLLILTALITVVLSVVNLIKHPQELKKTLMGVVVLGVLLAIMYFTATGNEVTDVMGNVLKDGAAGNVSKWVSALINFTGIMGLLGLVAIALGVIKSIK